jgi:hypothetical protein
MNLQSPNKGYRRDGIVSLGRRMRKLKPEKAPKELAFSA